MLTLADFEKTCFVIMPFGIKPVNGRDTNFDAIYQQIFKPAIEAARTEEGEPLKPSRTDEDAFSSSINQDMFDYILYSRLAIADISGSNPNALYELGARHALQDAGTVILRQKGHGIPFDIQTIKVFEYDHESDDAIANSRNFISKVLTETLKRNRLDSPIRQALSRQFEQRPQQAAAAAQESQPAAAAAAAVRAPDLDMLLRDAEEAVLRGDLAVARTIYQILLRLDPSSLLARMKLGMVLKNEGNIFEAHEEFATLVRLYPEYAEAWREKGVVESLILRKFPDKDRKQWAPHAIRSFERATAMNPDDADAWASWGGLLRRIGEEKEALAKYAKGAEVSDGHPYPLLNAVKLDAKLSGSAKLRFDHELMRKARDIRDAQASHKPPQDAPWSFFDLAEIRLFTGDSDGFLATVEDGLATINEKQNKWQVKTFRDGLNETLVETGIDLPGLSDGLKLLEEKLEALDKLNDEG